jgi:hypothetical protein
LARLRFCSTRLLSRACKGIRDEGIRDEDKRAVAVGEVEVLQHEVTPNNLIHWRCV